MLLYTSQSYLFLKTPFSNMHASSLLSSAAEPNVIIQLRNLYLLLIYEILAINQLNAKNLLL